MKSNSEAASLMRDEDDEELRLPLQRPEKKLRWLSWGSLALAVSVALNILILLYVAGGSRYLKLGGHGNARYGEATEFAGLVFDTPGTFGVNLFYENMNETAREEYWDTMSYDPGSVALDYEYAASLGLPEAQPFPWDYSKGLYFLNAYHSIHCLKIVWMSLKELKANVTLTFDYEHTLHCMDSLLEDVHCFADDTPRFTSEAHPGSPGVNQPRMCRDWNRLQKYSLDHTSCWRDLEPNNTHADSLLRYRYCPPDSPYNARIHAIWPDYDDSDDATTL